MPRLRFPIVVATIAALALVACGDATADGGLDGTITVFAAASLTHAFEDIAGAFEDTGPGVTVELNLAGSSSLREQVLAGAPADVIATANAAVMDQLVAAGEVEASSIFATNRLRIAVPSGNPGDVAGLDDFADTGRLIGLCAEQVPCGDLARRALAAAGVTPSVDTREPDVRALLTKIEAGELDAGLVYATDVVAADGVEGIDLPAAADPTTTYPIGTVGSSDRSDAAAAFVDFVLSDEGQAILAEHGFGHP